MKIQSAKFITSSSQPSQCPEQNKPEYAFIGRSNVGKSSLINALTNNKKLAKTSGKPGKTQLVNHFLINEAWYLVDLPGYGYAQVSKTQREGFQQLISGYFQSRKNLMCIFVLVDVRLDPQAKDLEFMEQLGQMGLPFVIVFTKADKLSSPKVDKSVAGFRKAFLASWEEMPQYFVTSATQKSGLEAIMAFIEEINTSFDISLIK